MKIIRMSDVKKATGYKSSTSIYLLISRGAFPKPIRIGARAIGWLESEITAYISALSRGVDGDDLKKLIALQYAERFSKVGL